MKTGFICEKCRSFYEDEPAAVACENSHVSLADAVIEGAGWLKRESGDHGASKYPHTIRLRFGDWVQVYGMTRAFRDPR